MSHLYDFWVHGRLEIGMYCGGKVGAASVALAVFPEEAVRDGAGPAVSKLEVKGVAAGGGGHHSTAWGNRSTEAHYHVTQH